MGGNVISIIVGGFIALLAVGVIEGTASVPVDGLSHGQRVQIARAAEMQPLLGADPRALQRAVVAATAR